GTHGRRNVPANLPYVLTALSDLLRKDQSRLAEQLWQNSCAALQVSWDYPIPNKLNINPDQD
ncbi:MAG: hypothetical protein VB956_09845, partial [Moraxella sp.]